MKERLLTVLKNKGKCPYRQCAKCDKDIVIIASSTCNSMVCAVAPVERRYKHILEYYVNEYGKDPDLIEVLI